MINAKSCCSLKNRENTLQKAREDGPSTSSPKSPRNTAPKVLHSISGLCLTDDGKKVRIVDLNLLIDSWQEITNTAEV